MIEDNFKSFMIELENNYIYNKTIWLWHTH
jgi:hypothetical protein